MTIVPGTKPRRVLDLSKKVYVGYESFSVLKENDVVSDDGMTLEPTLIEFDKPSGNSCEYPYEDFMASLRDSVVVTRLLKANGWFGEYEHPDKNAPIARIIKIEPTRYLWLIEKYWYDQKNNALKGRCHFCDPLGTTIAVPNMKRFGTNFAASVRSLTPNVVEKNVNGRIILVKKHPIQIITFDGVALPGFENARLMNPEMYAAKRAASVESLSTGFELQSGFADMFQNNMISDESVNILQDLYKVDLRSAESIILTKDRRVSFDFQNGMKLNVALESWLATELFR